MNMNNYKRILLFVLGFVAILSSCKDDDNVAPVEEGGAYTLAIRSNGDGEVTTDYLVTTDSLMDGEISLLGQGVEQSGYHFYQQTGAYLTTVTYTDANVATVYKLNDSDELEEHIQFTMGRTHLFYPVDDKNFIAMNIPRGGSENATFYKVNVETGEVSESATSVFTPTRGSGEQAYFSGMVHRGDQLFVPFFQIAASDFSSQMTDSAYVAIYSYPGLEYQGVITDERTGPIGAYAAQGHIFNTENNDIYTASTVAISSGFPQETRPSGFLRINAGESTFDESYFFNIEDATGGYKLCNTQYLGNNKVLASIYSFKEHKAEDKWTRRDVRLAIIDVVAQTVNYIDGVPVHYGGPTATFANQFIVDNDMIYIKITNDEGIFIYEVDPVNFTGTQGAEITDASAVYGFFNLKQ
ncbi:DUF4374 domain-containing protein [Fulvivirga kasyanovii]|uniref:DUF4374 domain-containing protein n=2 Tax=Fulvivirga kasyanovii TaxID=396812 RepID=A0ABW9RT71_9BACT|nr:DUF4374 domain-containing protein [Fulvivirga kasyanovii]